MIKRLWIASCGGALALCLATAGPALGQGQYDQVFPLQGKGPPSRGAILENGMSEKEVTLEDRGVPRKFPVNEILRITFSDEPPDLNAARAAVFQRNYNQALQSLQKVDPQRINRDFVKQDYEFYRAFCLAKLAMTEGGDKSAAITAMLNFAKAAPQNYHFYEAAEMLGDLTMASGKYADAAKYYTPIASAPWADYQLRANYSVGRALIGEKQYEQALERFEKVLGSDVTTAEAAHQKQLAAVGKAVCQAETGKADAAVSSLQDIINKNDPQDAVLFARTYNALGKCYLKLNKPREALLAFLHTDVLFYSDPDPHAEALYHLSKLWTEQSKSDRAVAARNTLRERYAGSVWAGLD